MLAAPVSGGIVGVGVGFFGCPPVKTSLQELVHLFPVLPPRTHGFAGGNLPFAAGSSGQAYLLSLLLRAARSQELTLTSSAVLRRRLPYRSWCIYSKSYLRGRTASPEVTCPLRPAPPAKHTCFHSSCEQHSLPGVGLTVAGLSSDEPPAHRSWRPDASLLPRIKSRSLMSIVSSGIGFLF